MPVEAQTVELVLMERRIFEFSLAPCPVPPVLLPVAIVVAALLVPAVLAWDFAHLETVCRLPRAS